MLTIPSRVIAACFALVGFAAAAIVGVVVGNSAVTVLTYAIVVMLLCGLVGFAAGAIIQQVVLEHIDSYKRQHPIPDDKPVAEASGVSTPNGPPQQGVMSS